MKYHPAYKAAKAARRMWYAARIGAVALLIGSIALAVSSGEGDVLLIGIPVSLYTLFKGVI